MADVRCDTSQPLKQRKPRRFITLYTVSQKNAPTLASYSFDKHGLIKFFG